MVTNGIFQTSSLNIVAWLSANDIDFVDYIRVNGNVIFVYERTEEITSCMNEYNTNEKLKKFIAGYRKARDVIKS